MNPLLNLPTYAEITIGQITFQHYEGSSVGDIDIDPDDAVFYPIGAPDVFNVYWAPGETLNDITAPGRPEYLYIQPDVRSEEHTSELQSLMRISYAVFCLIKHNRQQ